MGQSAKNEEFPIIYKRLYWTQYDGNFMGFIWPGYSTERSFNFDAFNALECSNNVFNFIKMIYSDFGDPSINIIAHSLGNMVFSQAMKKFNKIGNYIMMEAAVPASSYGFSEERYSIFWQCHTGN